MDLALGRLAERDDPRVEAIDEGTEGEEVELAWGAMFSPGWLT